jgi:hypothetical protein
MSTAHARGVPAFLGSLTLGLLLAGPAFSDDLLQDVKRRQELAAQRTEADVREAGREVAQLVRDRHYARAADRLRALLAALDEDTALTPERRTTLRAWANARLRDVEAEGGRRDARGTEPADRSARRQADGDRRTADSDRLARGLQEVRSLRAAGRTAEANRLADDLARRYPDSPAATAGRVAGARAESIAEARGARERAGVGFEGAVNGVARSATPEAGDYTLPPDWREKAAKRGEGPKPTPQEQALLKALQQTVNLNFSEGTLAEVLDYLRQQSGVEILVDKQTLESVSASYDTPIKGLSKRATLRTVLRKVLADLNLTYILKDGAVQVVTQEQAKATLTVRTYYIGDLVSVVDVRLLPGLRELEMRKNVDMILQSIQAIEPGTWQANGGAGTVTFDPVTMTLVVKQTAEMHFLLGGLGR